MTNSAKSKGDRGEREVVSLLQDLLGIKSISRAFGAGRPEDVGDIHGVPQTAVQVAWWADILAAIRTKIVTVEQQRKTKRVRFAATFIRMRKQWIVVQTPEQWSRMWKYAQMGVALEREEKAAKLPLHGRRH